jgi:K+-transporting ATPase KdpF subunit
MQSQVGVRPRSLPTVIPRGTVRNAVPIGGNTPTGIAVAGGAVAVVAAATVAAFVPVSAGGVRLGLMAAALAGFAAAAVDLRAVAFATVLAYLVHDGFLVNRMGDLTWTGAPDVRRVEILAAAAAVGLLVGGLRRKEWHGAGSGVRAVDDRVVSRAGSDGAGGGQAVNAENLVGLVLAVALTVFLVVALLFPERF